MDSEMVEILEEFFTEAAEGLDDLEQDLIKLEALAESEEEETDAETVDRIFRVLHTLKGGAGFLGLEKMAKLAHAGENLLDEVRGGRVEINKAVMDALLQSNDSLKELLDISRADENPDNYETAELIEVLEKLAFGGAETPAAPAAPASVKEEAPAPAPEEPAAAPAAPAGVEVNQDLLNEVMNDEVLNPANDPEAKKEEPAATPAAPAGVEVNQDLLNEVMSDEVLNPENDPEAKKEEPTAAPAAPAGVAVNQDLLNEVMSDEVLNPENDKEEEPAPTPAVETAPAEPERREKTDRRTGKEERRKEPRRKVEAAETTIRVETRRLDMVMNLVGELVLARNSLLRQMEQPHIKDLIAQEDRDQKIATNFELLSRVTQDLQMSVLGTRMQPIKKVFDKIPRQVRELKTQLSKEVNLVIEGEMTEVDKTLVEELSDPMVHLIRNSMDHGIENPDVRKELGKNPAGTLKVSAYYEGNNVVIAVKDDGAGIDPDKIRNIAIDKGVVSEQAAHAMSDQEAIQLILAPGFSTAKEVSSVSGRGVGMDVVNSKIKDMKGTLDIYSTLGEGTTMRINLPLTLAIMQALLVEAGGEGFAIPIGDITEVIQFQPDQIHQVNDEDVIELRGEVLPLFYLNNLSKVESQEKNTKGYVVVVKDKAGNMGIVIDELIGQEEAVVKPVMDLFEYNKAVSGATITGDGTVHMILDIPFMIKDLTHNNQQGL